MKITIHGDPIPKARARIFKNKYTGKEQGFDPQTTQKTEVKWRIKQAALKCEIRPIADAYHVHFDFFFRPPNDNLRNLRLWGIIPHNVKPDASNIIKFYEDAANAILYRDDAQIVRVTGEKHYSENPRTEIVILSKMQPDVTPEIKQLVKYCSPKDLEEITQDVQLMQKILSSSNLADTDNLENVSLGRLQPAAESLIRFGKKWGGVLSKIAK